MGQKLSVEGEARNRKGKVRVRKKFASLGGAVLSPDCRKAEKIRTFITPPGYWEEQFGFSAEVYKQAVGERIFYYLVGTGGPLSLFAAVGACSGGKGIPSTGLTRDGWESGVKETLIVISEELALAIAPGLEAGPPNMDMPPVIQHLKKTANARKRSGRLGMSLSPDCRKAEEIADYSAARILFHALVGFAAKLYKQAVGKRNYYYLVGTGGPLSLFAIAGASAGGKGIPSTGLTRYGWAPGVNETLVVISEELALEIVQKIEHSKMLLAKAFAH